jgi:hypothetical protein
MYEIVAILRDAALCAAPQDDEGGGTAKDVRLFQLRWGTARDAPYGLPGYRIEIWLSASRTSSSAKRRSVP